MIHLEWFMELSNRKYMRHCDPETGSRPPLRNASLMLTLIVLLHGCAADSSKTTSDGSGQVRNSANRAVVVSPEQKADFDAAMQFVAKEEYDKAAVLLDKVAKAEPQNAIPSVDLALVYEKQGKLKQAEESLKAALDADPENPVANNEYALLYRKTGRFADARALYEKTLEKYPNFIAMHKNLGVLCDLYLKDYDCAIKHYTIYSAVKQDDKAVKIWIADLKQRSGK